MTVTVKINDDCYVEIFTDVSETMNGWSKTIQPEWLEPEESPSEDRLWLNQHINILQWDD